MSHVFVVGGSRSDRARRIQELSRPDPLVAPVEAHRRLRGPYTAAGTILRAFVPDLLATDPALVSAHDVEILSMAPELQAVVPASRDTLTSLAVPTERTRFYSRMRTLRMSHGVYELLRDALAGKARPLSLVVDGLDDADPTDQELFAVLLRRLDAARLQLVLGAATRPDGVLGDALDRYAETVEARVDGTQAESDPAAYVRGECLDDRPGASAAYDTLDDAQRAALHDARADELAATGEWSLRWGAIAFHRERGSDADVAVQVLREALDTCIDLGFYDATVDLGRRGLAIVGDDPGGDNWWAFLTKCTTSLAALGRADEAEELYTYARSLSARPNVHRQAAYATAMLYTRHHEEELKDHRLAKALANQAIAFAGLIDDPDQRAFESAFMRNGLALIEVHLRNLPEALRLVDESLALLDEQLAPDEHRLHRSVLRYNRAQVYAGLGRLDEAIAEYDAVIAADPNYPEYYFDRGSLLRRLGRDEDALADYDTAIRLSPPFPEVYYNRADTLLTLGAVEAGLAALDEVLDIDPDFVDALVNRAGVRLELGDLEGARADAEHGLTLVAEHAHLLCVLGQLEAADGRPEAARRALDAAVAADPLLSTAWACRAAVAFETDDALTAVDDLTRAIDLDDSATLRFNRATALRALGQWEDARADLDRAAELAPDDEEVRAELAASM